MGSSVVNALSAHMDLKVYRDGFIYHDDMKKDVLSSSWRTDFSL